MRNHVFTGIVTLVFLLTSCSTSTPTVEPVPASTPVTPEWFNFKLTDVQTGESFTINDYSGKVILIETMAMWCPNCIVQANEVRYLHQQLGDPEDLVSISLDVDVNEDGPALKEYSEYYGFTWHFVIAQLEVARALGNLYTAEYLNPPLSPMMIIDREGNVHHLEYGIKKAATLKAAVQPYLNP